METLSRLVLTFLLNALWQPLLVTGAAVLGSRLLRRAPARYSHALWVMGLALSFLLPLTALSDSSRRAGGPGLILEALRSQSAPPQPAIATMRDGATPMESTPNLPTRLSNATSARRASGFYLSNALRRRSRLIAFSPLTLYLVLSFFLLSLAVQLTRLARAWVRTQRIWRSARARELPEAMAALAVQCQARMGLRNVALLCSSAVAGPATVGFFKPVIILPEAIFQDAPSEELTSALCHEMAHIRRRDYLLNLVCEFLFLPLAFHPAAWLLKRRIDETRELACDEAAVGLLSNSVYARSLVNLAHSIAPLALASRPRYTLGVFDANILEVRIMRLLDKQSRLGAHRARFLLVAAAMALSFAVLTAGAFSLTAVEKPQAKDTPASDARPFAGTWRAEFQGKRFLTLTLREDQGRMTGSFSPFNVNFDASGNLAEAEAGTHGGGEIVGATFSNGTLHFKCKDVETGEVDDFAMKLVDKDHAEFDLVGAPATPGSATPRPLVLTREPEENRDTADARHAPPGAGVRGGVGGGIAGGVTGGVRGGIVGPSAVRSVDGTGEVKGTVLDPSGARVPQAYVRVSNKVTGAIESTETNDTGEFFFVDLRPGTYTLTVTKVGFGIYAETVLLFAQNSLSPLEIVLQPGDVLQAIDVTAPSIPGALPGPRHSGSLRIRVGGLIEATKLVTMKKPDYPESARVKGAQGVVLLQAVISKEGVPLNLKVISSPDPELSRAALDAVQQWRYEPTLLNGEPIEVVTTIAVRFHRES